MYLQNSFISNGNDIIPPGKFQVGASNTLTSTQIKLFVFETVSEVLNENDIGVDESFYDSVNKNSDLCFGKSKNYISIHQYKNYIKKFNREKFVNDFPDISLNIDLFCLKLKSKVCLGMHPEKIDELVLYLKENNIKVLTPNLIKKFNVNLYQWFSKNCRGKPGGDSRLGKVDWNLIHEKISEKYECDFGYQKRREKFSKDFAINESRKILKEVIAEKGFWHPAYDLERKDKNIYCYLISLAEFRVSADRFDLELKGMKNTGTKPNWFAIAEELGEEFLKAMRIGHGEGITEIEYRNLEVAIDELNDTLELEGFPFWGTTKLYKINVNLYTWFKNNIRTEDGNIDWKKIINHNSVKKEVRLKFENSVK